MLGNTMPVAVTAIAPRLTKYTIPCTLTSGKAPTLLLGVLAVAVCFEPDLGSAVTRLSDAAVWAAAVVRAAEYGVCLTDLLTELYWLVSRLVLTA